LGCAYPVPSRPSRLVPRSRDREVLHSSSQPPTNLFNRGYFSPEKAISWGLGNVILPTAATCFIRYIRPHPLPRVATFAPSQQIFPGRDRGLHGRNVVLGFQQGGELKMLSHWDPREKPYTQITIYQISNPSGSGNQNHPKVQGWGNPPLSGNR
jgi:hypothetical protein